jgi:hypothetical protein
MEGNVFNGFLMSTSILRRWSHDELIPSVLCVERTTFSCTSEWVANRHAAYGQQSRRSALRSLTLRDTG